MTDSPIRHLIVNADDFGYSYSVNRGIIEAHTNGIVTSTSVMVDAIVAHEAKDLSRFTDLSIGLHFEVKEIVNVEAELKRQIEKFVSIVGRRPDHLDSHKKHTKTAGIEAVLQDYSQTLDIPVRDFGQATFIDSFFGMHADGDVSVTQLKKAIDQAMDAYNEIMCHVGYSDDYLREHSSYNVLREAELSSICNLEIKQYIEQKGIVLVNWRSLHKNLPLSN